MTTVLIILVALLLVWTIVLTIRLKNVKNGVKRVENYIIDMEFDLTDKIIKRVESKENNFKRLISDLYDKEKESLDKVKDYLQNKFKQQCLDLAIKACAGTNKDVLDMAKNIEGYLLYNEEKELSIGTKISIEDLTTDIIGKIIHKIEGTILTITLVDGDIIWLETPAKDGTIYKFPVVRTSIKL